MNYPIVAVYHELRVEYARVSALPKTPERDAQLTGIDFALQLIITHNGGKAPVDQETVDETQERTPLYRSALVNLVAATAGQLGMDREAHEARDKAMALLHVRHGSRPEQRGIDGEVWITLDAQGVAVGIFADRAFAEEDAKTYGNASWHVTGPYRLATAQRTETAIPDMAKVRELFGKIYYEETFKRLDGSTAVTLLRSDDGCGAEDEAEELWRLLGMSSLTGSEGT